MQRGPHRILLICASLTLSWSAHARATEYFVDALHGSDTNDGLSALTAKKTIQAGIDLATSPGDVVTVLPGEHTLTATIQIDSTNNGITVQALGEVVLTGSVTKMDLLSVSDVVVRGFTFKFPILWGLRVLTAADTIIERCRFVDGGVGNVAMFFGTGSTVSNVTVRQCLFDNLSHVAADVRAATATNLIFERCTFSRSLQTVNLAVPSPLAILMKNCAFYNNAFGLPDPGDRPTYEYCNFFLNGAPSPIGTSNTLNPLFIDPDNGVYFVKAGSPLLTGGENGGAVGAFGQGLHTSRIAANDEPTQGATAWANWVDAGGTAVPSSALITVNAQNELVLQPAVTEAAAYSPVFDTGGPAFVRSVDFLALEDLTPPAGARQLIDAVAGAPRREVRIRVSDAAFAQDPASTPPNFVTIDKQVKQAIPARFVQLEIVLRNDGD